MTGILIIDMDEDLEYFENGILNLEDYLFSTELFWNIPGSSSLTIGGLLLTKVRLQGYVLQNEKSVIFHQLDRDLDSITRKWRVAWENKIIREISSRLNLWKNYLADCWSEPGEFKGDYALEVRWRVMLQLLASEVSGKFKERYTLDDLDDRLRASFIPGDFIWDEKLISNLPLPSYWFLYGNIQEN